jgi:serine protease AprX
MRKNQQAWFETVGDRLDPGLVHQLKQLRQGKTQRSTLPVIVQFASELEDKHREELYERCQISDEESMDGELKLFNGFFGQMKEDTLRDLTRHEGVAKIFYDREVRAFLDVARKSTGADYVQAKEGLTGKDVTIAVIDTGIHPHPDLMKPDKRIIAFADLINGKEEPYDDQGHGTHCAGDAAGNGYESEGLYAGPAPEAKLIGVKVLDAEGGGQLSTVIKGVEWCVENKEKYGIRIISMSLGAPAFESYRDDPLAQAVEVAWHHGIVVCVAAGNEGPFPGTISTPGLDPVVITVGAVDDRNTVDRKDDEKASFSSRGPTLDFLVKPDIYSPGTDIISLNVPGSPIDKQLPEKRVGEHYIALSGTSMATPITAGIVALLLEANPNLSPNDVKSILMSTSQFMPGTLGDSAGYANVKKAVALAKSYRSFQEETVR